MEIFFFFFFFKLRWLTFQMKNILWPPNPKWNTRPTRQRECIFLAIYVRISSLRTLTSGLNCCTLLLLCLFASTLLLTGGSCPALQRRNEDILNDARLWLSRPIFFFFYLFFNIWKCLLYFIAKKRVWKNIGYV